MPPSSDAPGFVTLGGGDARVEVVPREGGRIRSLKLRGQEWLFDDVDAGWDEHVSADKGGEGARLPEPEVRIASDADGPRVECTWRNPARSWVLTRSLVVHHDSVVEARYEAQNVGKEALPFCWSARLLFPLEAQTRLGLPEGAQWRTSSLVGVPVAANAPLLSGNWPRLSLDGRTRDLSSPWSLPRRVQLAGWLELGGGRSDCQVSQGAARLTMSTEGKAVPVCGVVIDRAGATTSRGAPSFFGRSRRPVVALRPSFGAPERIGESGSERKGATWLMPGEPRRWTLILRGGSQA